MPNAPRDSRLTVPRLPPRHIFRPRLLAELDRAVDVPLTLLSAGPGAGKTVLLTDWAWRTGARAAWLTPTKADAEPQRFWPLLMSALRECDAEPRGPSAAIPRGFAPDLVQTLFAAVPESAAPLVVIIDDAHVLTHPDVLEGLDSLVRGWQPGLRLILAARSDPLLPLHRYRLAGQMRELRAADLAMNPVEIRGLLSAHGVSLEPRDFDLLAARTEGWAAGVRLSAMRMEGTEHPADFVSELALDQGSIGEYLVDEVLRRCPVQERRLLVETSFLDEVTGPLAGAVTGMTGCGEMLAGLARDNSFVIPLDAAREHYRYHQLLAEILRYLLRRQSPQAVPELQKRAAVWFEGAGGLGNALYWAVQAGDRSYAASLLARGGFAHAFVHRQDLSGAGLRDLLPPHIGPDPDGPEAAEFAAARSVIAAITADAESAARELQRTRAAPPDGQAADPDLAVTSELAELVLGQKAGDVRAVDAAADRLLGRIGQEPGPPLPGLRAAVLLAQAGSHLWHGRHDDIAALLQGALTDAEQEGPPGLELEVLAMMAFVDSYWSRPNHADDAVQQAEALLRKHTNLASPPSLELAAALRSLIAGDLADRARALQRILLPDVVGADPGLPVALVLGRANVLLTQGQLNEARNVLYAAGSRIPPALAVQRDIMLAALDTSLGRPRAALRLLRGYRASEFAVLAAVPRARAHLALGDLRSARDCVRGVLATASTQAGRYAVVDAMLCDAQIAQLGHDPERALEMIIRALDIARGEIVLPFLQVTDVFADLLARHALVAAQWPETVPRRPAQPPGETVRMFMADLPEPLTQREQSILRFLATSMSTAEIADELCLSVNTVKTHLAAIYRKLPARRRREAVVRARQLELI